jgi:phosphoserine aminotransferase
VTRPWNFSAGPSVLPVEVLQTAAAEMLDWHGSGMSVMEMSHRGKQFIHIYEQAEADLRALLALPDDYAILFTTGGAIGQNAIVPLNLIGRAGANQADYIVSGSWSEKSFKEAQRYGDAQVAASSGQPATLDGVDAGPYTWFPEPDRWRVRAGSSYVHFCSNETIGGVEFTGWPDMAALGHADVPLVVDASSNILSRPMDVTRAGLLYAGAQKNAGPAGLTLVIARRDLLGHALPACPSAFDYALIARNESMYNTPPTYAIYVAGLVFRWLLEQGGVAAIEQRNIAKARLLYDYIDQSGFYANRVHPRYRSRMNVPFQLTDETLTASFLKQADEAGLLQLKGHKSVGGMRASIYNALPLQAVQALVGFMQDFEKRHG